MAEYNRLDYFIIRAYHLVAVSGKTLHIKVLFSSILFSTPTPLSTTYTLFLFLHSSTPPKMMLTLSPTLMKILMKKLIRIHMMPLPLLSTTLILKHWFPPIILFT